MTTRAAQRGTPNNLGHLRERWGDTLLTVLTALFGLLLFVLAPLQAAGFWEAQGLGFAIAFAIAGGIIVLSGSRTATLVLLAAIGLSAVAVVLRLREPSLLGVFLHAVSWLLMSGALIWIVGRAVFGPGRVTYHRIMGAVLLYLTIGTTFVALYSLVGALSPDAFDGMTVKDSPQLASTLIYYSFGSLTGAGSDISPLHPVARSLTVVEAMLGQLYPATLLARLVTLQLES